MSESERRQRTISSTPRMTPEEVAGRTFASAFRGVSESDVRSFLKRVSDELTAARGREQELLGTIDELETRLREPQPLDEQALLDALGEETTRLLRSAREAATDIRTKAEERASRLVHDAHETADRVREDAEEILGVKTREAETVTQALLEEAEQRASDLMRVADERAVELRSSADQYGEDLRARVEREAHAEIETAREQAQTMLAEAASLRERIIDDLARRRELLTGQLEELRAGRDRLLDAYRIVKRTFLEATEALAQVEARATAARSMGGADPADLAGVTAAEADAARSAGLEPPTAIDAPAADETAATELPTELPTDVATGDDGDVAVAEAPVAGEPAVDAPIDDPPGAATDDEPTNDAESDLATPNLADVDDLFARLRAGAQTDSEIAPPVAASDAEATASEPAAPGGGDTVGVDVVEIVEIVEIDILSAESEPEVVADEEPAWLSERAEALTPLRVALVRQVKLAVGDEQNEVLDKVRRNKGKPTAASVLPDSDVQVASWAAVVAAKVSEAYQLARRDHDATVPDDLAQALARTMVEPLRDRLVAAIDGANEPGETTNQIAERIGARYREWKNRSAESLVEDALMGAYTRGLYDAGADESLLAWNTPPGGCCPDCSDNALEPTRKGEAFPTGQQYPPAHPGCRCTVVTVDSDVRATAGVEAESAASS